MSTFTCEIIGTGDGKLENLGKNDSPQSTSMVKAIVEDIVENVLDIFEDSYVATPREKSPCFFGTGDQKSDEDIKKKFSCYIPHVEKKTRLTDLVRNSKQILQKMMMSESKTTLQEQERKAEEEQEKLIQAIDLDCVQLSDIQTPVAPEEVPLPRNDSADILIPSESDTDTSDMTKTGFDTGKDFEQSDTEQSDIIKTGLDTFKDSEQSDTEQSDIIKTGLDTGKDSKQSESETDLITLSDMIKIDLLNKDPAQSDREPSSIIENSVVDIDLNSSKDAEQFTTESSSDMVEIGLNSSHHSVPDVSSTIKMNESNIIEIGLDNSEQSDVGTTTSFAKKLMTFPRATSRAKAVLTAKCRTLKREATVLKKKKWNVSSRIVNFFRKRRPIKKELEEDEMNKET